VKADQDHPLAPSGDVVIYLGSQDGLEGITDGAVVRASVELRHLHRDDAPVDEQFEVGSTAGARLPIRAPRDRHPPSLSRRVGAEDPDRPILNVPVGENRGRDDLGALVIHGAHGRTGDLLEALSTRWSKALPN
jgi:hypothetical protein